MYLVITEELCEKLGLLVKKEKTAYIANGQRVSCKETDTVEVHWKDRDTVLSALVIPGAEKILLGAIALEGLDLRVNPVTQELEGVHGDQAECIIL
jgi:clan AA aspartic protease